MEAYTIFLGEELWENVIDDMHSTADWAVGGMLWLDRKKAECCVKHLRLYPHEREQSKKFRVVKVNLEKEKDAL